MGTEHILLALLELGTASLRGLGSDKPAAKEHIAGSSIPEPEVDRPT